MGTVDADISAVEIVEKGDGYAIDDFILSLPTPVIILIVQQANQGIMDLSGWGLPAINPINPLLEPGSWESFKYQAKALVMPTIVLAVTAAASYSRYMKVTTLDVLGSDYLRTARAKGVPDNKVVRRHLGCPALGKLAALLPPTVP